MDGISKYSDGLANAGPEIEKSFAPSIKTISDGVTKLGTEFSESAKIIEMDAKEVQTKLESFAKLPSNTKTMKGVTEQIQANEQLNKEWGATTNLMKDVRDEFKALPPTIKVNEQEVTNLRNAFYKFRDEPTVENLKALQNAYTGFEGKIIGSTKAADTFNEKLVKIPSEKVESAFGTINDASKDVAKNMEEITPAVSTVESEISKNTNKMKDAFGGVFTSIRDTTTSIVSGLGSFGKQTAQTLNKNIFTPAISEAKEFSSNFKNAYSEAFTNYGKESQEAANTDLKRIDTIDQLNGEIKILAKAHGANADNLFVGNSLTAEQIKLLANLDTNADKTSVTIRSLGGSVQSIERALRNAGGSTSMLTFAIGQSITMVVQLSTYLTKFSITATQVASNLDLQIRRIMIASGESYEAIRSGIFDVANATGTSADQVAEAFRKMIFAGIDYATTMEVLKNGVLVATASAEDFVTVVKLGVSSLNVFHKNASQLPEVFNSIYVAASKSPAAVQALAQSLEYLGPVAASMGISLEEITAVLTVLSQRGIEGSKAGTAMRRVLTEMAKASEDMLDALHVMNVYAYEGETSINGITVSAKDLEDQMRNSRKSVSEYERTQIDLNVTQRGLNTSIVEYDNAINLIQAEIDKLNTRISAHQKMIDSLTNSYRNIEYSMTNLSDSIERYNGLLSDTRYREEALSKELEKRLASAPEAVKKQYEAIVAGQEKIKAGAEGSAFTSATDLIGIKNQLDATAQQREGYEDIIGKLENQRLHQEMILKTIQEQNKAIVKSHEDIIYSLEKETQLREVEITSLKEQSQNMRDLYAYTENSLNVINAQIEYQNALYEQAYKTLTQNNFEMRNGIDIIMDWSAAAQGALGNAQKTSAQLMAELTNIFGLRGVESITALFDLSSMLSSDAEGVETLRTQIEVLIDEMLSGGLQTKEQQILMTSIQAELNRAVNDTTKTQLESSKAGITMFQKQQEGISLMTKLMDKLNSSMSGLLGTIQKLSPALLVVGDAFRTLTFLILTFGRVSSVRGMFGGMANELKLLEVQRAMGGEMAKQAETRLVEISAASLKQKEAIENTKKFWLGLAKPVDISAKNIGSTIGKMAASSKASLLALGTTVSGTFKKVSSVMVNSMNWSAIKPSISLLGAKLIPSLSKIGKLAAGELLNIWTIVPKMLMGGLTSLKFAFSGVTKMIKTQLLPTLIPLTPILAGIGVAIGLVVAYKKNWLGIQDKLSPVVDNFRWIIGKLWEGIKWLGESILNVIKGFNDWVKSIPGLVTALKILLAPITLIVKAFELINGWIANMRLTEEAEKIDSFAEVWDECNKEIGDTIPLLAGSKVAFDETGKAAIQLADNVKESLMAQLGPRGFGLYSNTLNNWLSSAAEEYNKKINDANAKFAEGSQERLNAYKEAEAAFMKTLDAMSKYLEDTMLYVDKEWREEMGSAVGGIIGEMQNVPDFIAPISINLNDQGKIEDFMNRVSAEVAEIEKTGKSSSEALVIAYSNAFGELTGNATEATDYINTQVSRWASSPQLREFYEKNDADFNDFLMDVILGIDGLEGRLVVLNDGFKNTNSFMKEFGNSATRLSNALAFQLVKADDKIKNVIFTYINGVKSIDDITSGEISITTEMLVNAFDKASKDGVIDIQTIIDALKALEEEFPTLGGLIKSVSLDMNVLADEEKVFETYKTDMKDAATSSKKLATGFTEINVGSDNANKHLVQLLPTLQGVGKIVAANKIAFEAGAISQEKANKVIDEQYVRLQDVIDSWVEAGKVTKEEAIVISENVKTYIGDATNATLEAHAALLEQLNTKYADLQKNVDDGIRVIDQMASDGENVDLLMVGILSGINDDAWGNFLDIIKNYPQLLSKFGDEMIRMQTGLDPFTTDLYESTEAIKSNENALRTLVMAYEAGAPWAQKYMDKLVPSSSEIKAAGLFNRALSTTIDLANQFEFKGKEDLINGLTDVNKKLEQTSDSFEKDLELIKEISKISPVTGMTMAERLMKGANAKEQAKIMYEVTQSIKESTNMLPDLKSTIDKISVSMEHATVGLDKIVEALYTMGYLTEEDKKVLDPYMQDTKDRAEEILKTSNGIANAFAEYGIIAKDDAGVMKNISDEFVKILTTGKDITKMSDEEFIEMIKLTGASDDQKKAVIELKDQLGYSLDNWKAFASLNPEIQKALLSYLSSTEGVNRNFQNFMNSLSQDLVPLVNTTSAKILTDFLGTTDYAKEATLQSINDALNEIGVSANSLFGQFISALPEKLQGPVGQFIGSIQAGIQKISPEISYWLLSGVTKATEGARGSFVELLESLRSSFSSFGEMLYSMLSSVFDALSKSNSLTSILSGLNYKNINANIGRASGGFLGNMMQQVVNVNVGGMNFPDISSFSKWLQNVINGLTRQMDKTASAVVR
jgi:hypothetical protein